MAGTIRQKRDKNKSDKLLKENKLFKYSIFISEDMGSIGEKYHKEMILKDKQDFMWWNGGKDILERNNMFPA